MGASSAAMSAAAARYGQIDGANNWDSTVTNREMLVAESGTISFLRVDVLTAPGAGKSLTFALMLNGVAQALTCAITESATSAEDVTHTVAVTAGDRLALRCTPAGTPTTSLARWSTQYEPTAAGVAVWGTTSDQALSTVATRYNAIGADGLQAWNATETTVSQVWATACTITSLYVFLSANVGSGGDTFTFRIVVNGTPNAGSALALVDAAESGNVTGISVAIAPGDLVSIECVPTGTPQAVAAKWAVGYAPSVNGQFNVSSGNTLTPTANGFNYLQSQATIVDATENNRIMVPGAAAGAVAVRVLAMYMACVVAPGVGTSRSATLRKNGADTSFALTVSGTNTQDSKQGSVTIDNGDDFVYQFNALVGAPAASGVKFALRLGPPGGVGPPGGGGKPHKPPHRPPPGGGGSLLGPVLKKLRFPEKVI